MSQVDEQLKQLLSFKWMSDYIINYSDEDIEQLFHDMFDFAYSKIDNSDYFTNEYFYELLSQLSEFYYIKDIDKEKIEIIKQRLIDTYEEITTSLDISNLNKLRENILICCFRIAGNINCFEYLYFIDNDWVNYSIKLKTEALYTIRNCVRNKNTIPHIFFESPQDLTKFSIEDVSNWNQLILLLKQKNGSIFKLLEPLLSTTSKDCINHCNSDHKIDEITKKTIVSDFNQIIVLIKESITNNFINTIIKDSMEQLDKQNKKTSTSQKEQPRIIFKEVFSSEFMLSKLLAKLYSEFLNYNHSNSMTENEIILLDRILDIPGAMPISKNSFNSLIMVIENENYDEKIRAKLLIQLSKLYEIDKIKYLDILKSFLSTSPNRKSLLMEYSLLSFSNCLYLNQSLIIDYYNYIPEPNNLLMKIEEIIMNSKEDNMIREKALFVYYRLELYHLYDKLDQDLVKLPYSVFIEKKLYMLFSPMFLFNHIKLLPRMIKRIILLSKLLHKERDSIPLFEFMKKLIDNFSDIALYGIDVHFSFLYQLYIEDDLFVNHNNCKLVIAYSLLKKLDNNKISGNEKLELLYSNVKCKIFSVFDPSSSITISSESELQYAYELLELLWKKHSELNDNEITEYLKKMAKYLIHKYYLDKPSWKSPWGRELHIKAQEIYAEMKKDNIL